MRRFTVLAVAIFLAFPLHAGLVYQFKSVSEGNAANMIGTAKVEGANFRMELSEGDGVIFKNNSVILSQDGGKTMMILDPKKKEYYRLSLEETFNAMSSMMQSMGGMMEMSIDNQKVDVKSLGAGESIEGYATNKYQINTSYTLNIQAMGMNMGQEISTETTTWATDEIDPGFGGFIQQRTFRTGMEDLDKLIAKQVDAVKGFPLKAVTKTAITARGRTSTGTTTMTVTGIKETNVSEGEFEVPTGYREVDSPLAALQKMQMQ